MQSGRTKVKSKQKLIHVIQLCGRQKGMLYITVIKIRGVKGRGVKNRTPVFSLRLFSGSQFFPGPQAFCKKAVERVRSKKNILNRWVEWSGVEWVEWFFLAKAIYVYIIRSGSMSWLTWCALFLIWTHIFRVIDENVRKISKNGDLKTRIYGSKKYIILQSIKFWIWQCISFSVTIYIFRDIDENVWKIEYHRMN